MERWRNALVRSATTPSATRSKDNRRNQCSRSAAKSLVAWNAMEFYVPTGPEGYWWRRSMETKSAVPSSGVAMPAWNERFSTRCVARCEPIPSTITGSSSSPLVSAPFPIPLGLRFQKNGEEEVACALALLQDLDHQLGRRFLDALVGDALYLQAPFVKEVERMGLIWAFTSKENQPDLLREAERFSQRFSPIHF